MLLAIAGGLINLVILIIFILGFYSGWKKGFFESSIRFVGNIIAFICAYVSKNELSMMLYTNLPFFKWGGVFQGVSVINIMFYELIAFIIVYGVALIIANIVYRVTGIADKIFSAIMLIGVPNKVLGGIFGLLEALILVYFGSFAFMLIASFTNLKVEDSCISAIQKTPFLSKTFGPTFDALEEIVSLADDYQSLNSKKEYNYKALNILLKYKIISPKNANELIRNDKIIIDGAEELVDKYEEKEKDK